MRVIDIDNKADTDRWTILSYGQTRSGKTRWASSWPRPLFLSDASEGGWKTTQNMNRRVFFEPNRKPLIWAIEEPSDMHTCINDAKPLIARGEVKTLVIDSLTFYADMYFNMIDAAVRSAGRTPDNRLLHQNLQNHLRDLRITIHNLPCNVIWTCLAKEPDPEHPIGGPMLSGQNGQKFAASCDYIMYHRTFSPIKNAPLNYEIRTKQYENYKAGGRDEGKLSDPLGFFEEREKTNGETEEIFNLDCTYRTFALSLGLEDPQKMMDGIVNASAPLAAVG